MTWDDGNGNVYRATGDGNKWDQYGLWESGAFPGLPHDGTSGTIIDPQIVSTSASGSPYALQISTPASSSPAMNPTAITDSYSRKVVVAKKRSAVQREATPRFSVEVVSLQLKRNNGSIQKLDFVDAQTSDEDIWQKLSSKKIRLDSGIDSVLLRGAAHAFDVDSVAQGDSPRLGFELVDVTTGKTIRPLGIVRTIRSNGRIPVAIGERLSGLNGREVFVRPVVQNVAWSANMVATLVHIHALSVDSSASPSSKGLLSRVVSRPALPVSFAIHENYPNPFNPSTTINFDLAEPSQVSLIIFDLLGRKVAELENGMMEAGYHSTMWNASNAASGMYFARFTPTDMNGNAKLSKIAKLVLNK